MKIIKTKTYNGMKGQIDMLTKQVLKQQHELHTMQNTVNRLANDAMGYSEEVQIKTLEIKNLKALCTKNGVDYKHLYKKDK